MVRTRRRSGAALPGFVLESLEVLEGVEGGGLVEVDVEEGLAEVLVLGAEHLQLGIGRRRGRGRGTGGLAASGHGQASCPWHPSEDLRMRSLCV